MKTVSKPCKWKYIVTSKPIEDQTIYRNQDLFCWQLSSITKTQDSMKFDNCEEKGFCLTKSEALEESTENQKTELDRKAFADKIH